MPVNQQSYVFTAVRVERPSGYQDTFVKCVEVPVYAHGKDIAEALRQLGEGLAAYLAVRASGEFGPGVERLAEKKAKLPPAKPLIERELARLPRQLPGGLWQLVVPAPLASKTGS